MKEVILQKDCDRAQQLLDNSLDIAFRIKLKPVIRYEYISSASQPILGYKPEKFYSDPNLFEAIIHPDDRALLRDLTSGKDAKRNSLKIRWSHKNKTLKWTETSVVPVLDAVGTVMELEGYIRDVTERVQLETEMHQSQKLTELENLSGGIAHDFNNILAVILCVAEDIRLRLPSESLLQKKVAEIVHAGERGAKLIEQLMTVARKKAFDPKVVMLNDSVSSLVSMLTRIVGEHIEIKLNLGPDLWSVKIDPSQLEQVLLNLVVNARDALSSGGAINVETCNFEVSSLVGSGYEALELGSYVVLSVADNGCGMSRDVAGQIFDPFFTTKGNGTGLGLATVSGIIKQSGGHIFVSSELGKGSTFKIFLPKSNLKVASIEKAKVAPEKPSIRGSEVILLVEDEKSMRLVEKELLEENGYKVIEASNGKEALQLFQSFGDEIQLLLTDIIMESMSGLELANLLQTNNPKLKALFLSGYSQDIVPEKFSLQDDQHFLNKPFKAGALLKKIREILD